MSSVSTQVLRDCKGQMLKQRQRQPWAPSTCQTGAGPGCHGASLLAGNVASAFSFYHSSCLVGGSSSKKEEKMLFVL